MPFTFHLLCLHSSSRSLFTSTATSHSLSFSTGSAIVISSPSSMAPSTSTRASSSSTSTLQDVPPKQQMETTTTTRRRMSTVSTASSSASPTATAFASTGKSSLSASWDHKDLLASEPTLQRRLKQAQAPLVSTPLLNVYSPYASQEKPQEREDAGQERAKERAESWKKMERGSDSLFSSLSSFPSPFKCMYHLPTSIHAPNVEGVLNFAQTHLDSHLSVAPTLPASVSLRARRLQRRRALCQPDHPAAQYIRATEIESSPILLQYFSSANAAIAVKQKLMAGVMCTHHDAVLQAPVVRHIMCSPDLELLRCMDVSGNGIACQLINKAITKVTRGINSRALIMRFQQDPTHSSLPEDRVLSLCTMDGSIDLEFGSEAQRDEWYLAFDFLVYYWNLQRKGVKMLFGEGGKGSSISISVLHHLTRLSHHTAPQILSAMERSQQALLKPNDMYHMSTSSNNSLLWSPQLYEVIATLVHEIDVMREKNRLALIEGFQQRARLQQKIEYQYHQNSLLLDRIRVQNAA